MMHNERRASHNYHPVLILGVCGLMKTVIFVTQLQLVVTRVAAPSYTFYNPQWIAYAACQNNIYAVYMRFPSFIKCHVPCISWQLSLVCISHVCQIHFIYTLTTWFHGKGVILQCKYFRSARRK